MYCLHHLKDSRSQRIVWMFELLNIDYEIKVYFRDAQTNLAPPELKKIHPLGTAPVLTHEDSTVSETGAICEYLVKQTGDTSLIPPKDHQDFIDVQFWSHFSEGSFIPPLVTSMVLNKGREKASPFFIKFVVGKFVDAVIDAYFGKAIARNLQFLEGHLKGKTWLVGEKVSVADIQMSFPLEAMYKNNRLDNTPNIKAYVERFMSDSHYQTAMKKMQEAEQAAAKS